MEQIIVNKLKEKKLADTSIKFYLRNLQKLNNDEPIKNLRFLFNYKNIVEKLNNIKLNTRKNYLISIVSVLNCFVKDNALIEKLCYKYYKLMKETSQEQRDKPTEELTETQKKNWIEWDEVVKVWETLNNEALKYFKKRTLTEKQYNLLLTFVILSLYVKIPPRRNQEWQCMFIKNILTSNDTNEKNYLLWEKQQLIFNKYKTSKTHKQQIYNIPEELKQCLILYLKHHPIVKGKITNKTNTHLLVYYDKEPLTQVNAITRILNKLFKKNIGSSLLRHIFLTDKYGDENKEREEISKAMGHTERTQHEYIKNVEPKEKKEYIISFD